MTDMVYTAFFSRNLRSTQYYHDCLYYRNLGRHKSLKSGWHYQLFPIFLNKCYQPVNQNFVRSPSSSYWYISQKVAKLYLQRLSSHYNGIKIFLPFPKQRLNNILLYSPIMWILLDFKVRLVSSPGTDLESQLLGQPEYFSKIFYQK